MRATCDSKHNMVGIGFLHEEPCVAFGLLGISLFLYVPFLELAFFLRNRAARFLRLLAFLQVLALSSGPFVLTVLERPGPTVESAGVRLLEERALHAVRYKVLIRPLMGYAFYFSYVIKRNFRDQYRAYTVSKVHDAASDRSSGPMKSSWISIFDG